MKYRPTYYNQVFVVGSGSFLPGEPIDNERMDQFIAPLNAASARIKRRVLADNGIQTRYYAIHPDGTRRYSAAQMGAAAVNHGLTQAGMAIDAVTLLATATSGGDLLMPGFGNMLQGELRAPPMETRSHHGICAAGIAALKDAANHIDNGSHATAVVTAVEYPSRLFRYTRYHPLQYDIDFDAHFLRWMLSDGAGACVLSSQPSNAADVALRVDWIQTKSFSGDYPVCMRMGHARDDTAKLFMDYASFNEAELAGALLLRQDIRLLPQLFEVAVHEYIDLVKHGYVLPDTVDHFLSHYSSEKLGQVCDALMQKAGLGIPRDKWFSNLIQCGNTGSASIFIMLADFMRQKKLLRGQRIFCFVPESGRFTVSYVMLTVVDAQNYISSTTRQSAVAKPAGALLQSAPEIAPPHDHDQQTDTRMKETLQALAGIWHQYRSHIWRTPFVTKILNGRFRCEDYLAWMESWIPQVQEGSQWMRKAIANLPQEYAELKSLVHTHADEEQFDFKLLFRDYQNAGGKVDSIEKLQRNPGGAALNAYMHCLAETPLPVGLLGGIYIIEGTGQRIVPVLLPKLRAQLDLPDDCFQFLKYHGQNDINHLTRWLQAVSLVMTMGNTMERRQHADAIVNTAKHVADLYSLQWEFL